jgi:hypothetical protein
MTERVDFIAEILREAEIADAEKKVELDALRADQLLSAIAVIENQMNEVSELVEKEVRLLEEYRNSEWTRQEKKLSWLRFQLEGYARSTGEKTMRLPHGTLKLRKGRERVAVVRMDEFLKEAQSLGLLRTVPESHTTDAAAVLAHIRRTGHIPNGVEYFPADVKFTYSTTTNKEEDDERE